MSKYCTNCGHKQESSYAKFCSSCGEPLSGVAKKCDDKPSKSSSKAKLISEDETDATEVPQISQLQVDVELPSNVVEMSNQNGQLTFSNSKFQPRTLQLDG